jgi:polyhydroxyalkanoate synthesis repressor PhaR
MKEPRVIKKYPNRRLYDTVTSHYVTLLDIRRLVVEHIDFVVFERKTGRDITYPILLQVIAELEQPPAVLTCDLLKQAIRSQTPATATAAAK